MPSLSICVSMQTYELGLNFFETIVLEHRRERCDLNS